MEHAECERALASGHESRITRVFFSKLGPRARSALALLEFSDIFRDYGADSVSL